jgi:hypothetical protein
MKMIIGFLVGMVVCLALVLGISKATNVVDAEEAPGVDATSTELSGLLPDIGKIYRTCLSSPYREVESEIKDKDIANYYHKLMEQTSLDKMDTD